MLNAREIMELQKLSGMEKFSKLTVKQYMDKEKLIELFTQMAVLGDYLDMSKVADHLVANSVTVQKHGRWVRRIVDYEKPGYWKEECSICGCDGDAYAFTYCPCCGAKMDGGAEDGK